MYKEKKIIEDKYKQGKLTCNELHLLREQLASESDDVIAARMKMGWLDEDFDVAKAELNDMESVLGSIHRTIKKGRSQRIVPKIAIAFAAALIPVSIGISMAFYTNSVIRSEQIIEVSTGAGEQSTVTLPDGTIVRLNSNSELTYSPGAMFGSVRRVGFRGEALFDVARDESHPFIVNADRMNVKVLGTKFDLLSREDEITNKLLLLEGRVSLESVRNDEKVTVNPGEEAVMNKQTMTFSVKNGKNPEISTAWLRKEIVAKNVTLQELFSLIKDTYGVSVEGAIPVGTDDLFSGTLPSDNLTACAKIIEYAYGGITLKILNDKIQIAANK